MTDYIAKHKPEWTELEALVMRARRSLRGMSPEDLQRLDTLYRRSAIHLAQVSTRTRDATLLRYLNDLVASAHSLIYVAPRHRLFSGVGAFVVEGFGRAVARTWRFHLAAAALIVLGAVLAYVAARQDPAACYALLPAAEVRQLGAGRDRLEEDLRSGRDMSGGKKFIFVSFLFGHNLKVGVMAMATGALAAVPCVLLLVYNGMILGAFTAVHHASGIYGEYWAWILPHGVTELPAIALCGGVGLSLGYAVICPGRRSRAESLRDSGIEAARICLGVAGMLVLAAVVESYLRQSHLPTGWRFVFAGVVALFWTAYFAHGFARERTACRVAMQEG
jgi:uncharacterized membrane protein SpoIIM required for sporulation